MKLSISILIASVLLLSSANGSEKTNSSKPIGANEHQSGAQYVQAAADTAPTNAEPFETKLLETVRAMADQQKAANEQNNASNKSWDSPSMLVQIGLFVVGAGYTIFAALQWSAIKRQAAITEAGIEVARVAANAAEESAKAVDAQLHVNRPFLVVIRPEVESRIMNMNQGSVPRSALIKARNDGLGPADIVGYDAHWKVIPWSSIDDDPKASDIFPNQPGSKIIGSIVAAGKTIELPNMDIDINPMELDSINEGKSRLAVYGIFHCRGGPEKIYWTRFFYWHLIDLVPPVTEIAYSQELNSHS